MRPPLTVRRLRRARSRLTCERGFTLIEALVTMIILGIVLGSLTGTFVSATRAELDMNRRFQAQEQARLALDKLRREIHCASGVTQTSGSALTAGTQYSGIAITLPSYCQTGSGSTQTVMWCVTGSSAPYSLSRIAPSTGTCTGGTKQANYLTTSVPFCLPQKTTASCTDQITQPSNALPTLHLDLPVNVKGASAPGTSKLVDDIALRNAGRA